MKVKILAFMGLVVLVTSIALAVVSRRKNDEQSLKRLRAIKTYWNQSGGYGPQESPKVYVFQFSNWTFPLGRPKVGNHISIGEPLECLDPELRPFWRHIRTRQAWLSSLENPPIDGHGSITIDFKDEKPMRAVQFIGYGVEVVKVTDASGKTKYRAIGMEAGGMIGSAPLGQPIPYPTQKGALTRSDFVNPEDIDWLFGVDDFSKAGIVKTSIP